MKKKIIMILSLMIVVFSFAFAHGKGKSFFNFGSAKVENNDILASAKKVNNKISSIEEKTYTEKASEVYNKSGDVIGYYVTTMPYSDNIQGYNGSVPVIIVMDKDEKVIGTELLPNRETPSFVRRVENRGFFDSWNGTNIKNAGNIDVDTVAGATYTSRAVIQGIQARTEVLD